MKYILDFVYIDFEEISGKMDGLFRSSFYHLTDVRQLNEIGYLYPKVNLELELL